jgi:hypothetical protein
MVPQNLELHRFIDKFSGGWYPQLGADQMPSIDLYHALQACIVPLLPTTGSITRGLITSGVKLQLWPNTLAAKLRGWHDRGR